MRPTGRKRLALLFVGTHTLNGTWLGMGYQYPMLDGIKQPAGGTPLPAGGALLQEEGIVEYVLQEDLPFILLEG